MIKPQEPGTIYIGLDPSLAGIGWALLDGKDYGTSGTYIPQGTLDEKLLGAHAWLDNWLEILRGNTTREVVVVIEMPYVGQNADTHYKLSSLSGVLRICVQRHEMKMIDVFPTARCRAIGLKGNASKKEILERVNEIYNLDIDSFDESDAIALALTGRNECELPKV